MRDDSTLNIGLNRREIAELLNRIRIKLEHDSRESAAGKFGLWDICKMATSVEVAVFIYADSCVWDGGVVSNEGITTKTAVLHRL